MKVVKENIGHLNEIIKITVENADYSAQVEKALKEYKKKANVPGFRPGMVPMAIVNKMYRKGVTADETYKLASGECYKYLQDNKIEILGDPMPSETQPELNFENNSDLEFHFEIGVAPEIQLDLPAIEMTKYSIKLEDKMVDSYKKNYLQRFGKLVEVDKVESNEALNVILEQGDKKIDEAYVGLVGMSEEERAPFIGKVIGDKMEVNVNELYKTPSQRAAVLQVKEDELDAIDPKWSLTIDKIKKFDIPEASEEILKEAFPNGDVKTVEEFDNFAKAEIEKSLENESKYKLALDTRKTLTDAAAITLPESFLKKWIFAMNEGKYSAEEIEKEFPQFVEMMSWDIIKKKYVLENDMKVEKDELIAEAKNMAQMQFVQYGMPSVEDSLLTNYANQIISDKNEARKLYDAIYERKVIELITEKVKIKNKSLTVEKFGELLK